MEVMMPVLTVLDRKGNVVRRDIEKVRLAEEQVEAIASTLAEIHREKESEEEEGS